MKRLILLLNLVLPSFVFGLQKSAPQPLVESSKKIAVIVPVYREFENGNLKQLISDFRSQTNQNYQLFIIVNHTSDASNQAKEDNQKAIKYIESLNDSRIVLIKALDQRKRRIGAIRQLGFEIAKSYFKDLSLDQLIIAHFDADSRISNDYIDKIISEYNKKPRIKSLLLNMKMEAAPGSSREILQTTFKQRYRLAHRDFEELLYSNIQAGSPRITSTAKTLDDVGGIPKIDEGEDFKLSELLYKQGALRVSTDISIVTSDRARDDGYEASERLAGISAIHNKFVFLRNPQALILENAIEYIYKERRQVKVEELRKIFAAFDLNFDATLWLSLTDEKSAKLKGKSIKRSDLAVDVLSAYLNRYEKEFLYKAPDVGVASHFKKTLKNTPYWAEFSLKVELAEKNHNEWAKQNRQILRALFENSSDKFAEQISKSEFFRQNSWIASEIKEVASKSGGDKEKQFKAVLKHFQQEFPDWFLNFNETPVKRVVEVLEIAKSLAANVLNTENKGVSQALKVQLLPGVSCLDVIAPIKI